MNAYRVVVAFRAGLCLLGIAATNLEAATYYIDSDGGNDGNPGTSEMAAWQSFQNVNGHAFAPGDQILLKAGSHFTGQFAPKGAGSEGSPIVVDQYGSGALPVLEGNGAVSDTVLLENSPYWEINHLDVSNKAPGQSPGNLVDLRGIGIFGRDFGTIKHIYIKNCEVHDVTGKVGWIGGVVDGGEAWHGPGSPVKPGVNGNNGWFGSKNTGGIVFNIVSSADLPVKTNFDDIQVDGCKLKNNSYGAITIKSSAASWSVRKAGPNDPDWNPNTNVKITNNQIDQGGPENPYAVDGIYMTCTRDGLVENNSVTGAGACGIELYWVDKGTVRHNEAANSVKKGGSVDFCGIDADTGTTHILFEGNYVHGNGQGIIFYEAKFGDAVARYNVLQNNGEIELRPCANATLNIYNNTVYSSRPKTQMTTAKGKTTYRNNIFYTTQSDATFAAGAIYDHNCYFGMAKKPGDAGMVDKDPMLADPGKGADGFDSANAYKLQDGSPCKGAGVTVPDAGTTDFYGNPLPAGAPNIGAAQN